MISVLVVSWHALLVVCWLSQRKGTVFGTRLGTQLEDSFKCLILFPYKDVCILYIFKVSMFLRINILSAA